MLPSVAFANNGEDNQPPALKSIKVLTPQVNAGGVVKIKVEVEENGTGLIFSNVQIANGDEHDINRRTVFVEKGFDSPQYSSSGNLITYTFEVQTTTLAPNGDWFVEKIEFNDVKGNCAAYRCSGSDNTLRAFVSNQPPVAGDIHFSIRNSKLSDYEPPTLKNVKLDKNTIEKPGSFRLEATSRG